MAFLKGIKDTIEVPVSITMTVLDENDQPVLLEINPVVIYKRFKRTEARKVQTEIAKISQEAAKAIESGDMTVLFSDRLQFFDELLLSSVVGWRKMPGSDGEDIPFSQEVLEEAAEDTDYYKGLMSGLRHALGFGESILKGSEAAETKN